ncbi:NAD(P)H-dependent oxidoreductase [Mucilaginibacter sp. KACC 22063]|uniref:NAD(P)H-dependent oxidoreductase n=1 Tax=Mucilaginibacter sp. KACC 22063 TaxID=3025666 RepID=UPI0023656AEE|nr:NAD(P)H-dependent oxidoreductase [Mucilaginibacter sp. KACC 22063]WDF54394.1 NAD(P)H-dependent oxidoreductase [Mucilaginibacter sp. KACC 22063]
MKQVVIINADFNKGEPTRTLIETYTKGARQAQAVLKEIIIADLKFNPNKLLPFSVNEPEPDLLDAIEKIKWANHIVIFCPVYKDSINFKIKGFFDRIFMPDQVFVGRYDNFSGRSARIISILDEPSWKDWRINQRPTYLAIKRSVLEKRNVNPVHTSTIGYFQSLDNTYANKWLKKLHDFGEKLI